MRAGCPLLPRTTYWCEFTPCPLTARSAKPSTRPEAESADTSVAACAGAVCCAVTAEALGVSGTQSVAAAAASSVSVGESSYAASPAPAGEDSPKSLAATLPPRLFGTVVAVGAVAPFEGAPVATAAPVAAAETVSTAPLPAALAHVI